MSIKDDIVLFIVVMFLLVRSELTLFTNCMLTDGIRLKGKNFTSMNNKINETNIMYKVK